MKEKTKEVTPRFKLQLTEEQKLAKEKQLNSYITVLTGKQGTSKTLLQCNIQFTLLLNKQVDKIIITRPMVEVGTKMGAMPGDVEDKMNPFIGPIIEQFYELRAKEEIDTMLRNGKIEIVALQHFRGRNVKNQVLIVDEQANVNAEELKLIGSRLCKDGRIIFTCDERQIDISDKSRSAAWFIDCIKELDGIAVIELKENFRHPLAIQLCDAVEARQKELKQIT